MVNKMRYDINNLLNLDYLKSIISQLNNEVNDLKSQLEDEYDIDKLIKLNIDDIKNIFSKYGLPCVNLIQYLDSDFINQDWEYADLFADDIDYSKELEEKLHEMSLLEVNKLNEVIKLNNQKKLAEIDSILEDISDLSRLLEILDANYFVLEEDISWIIEFTYKQNCDLALIYHFSSEISKMLISKNKEILENKASEDEREFETSLDDIYGKEEENLESIYLEKINTYYEKYENIFQKVRLGKELDEIMELSNELVAGVDEIKTLDDFCISLGSLFYKICNANDNQDYEQLMLEVIQLDELYDKCLKKANILLDEIDAFRDRLGSTPVGYLNDEFADKLHSLCETYREQLLGNMFDDSVYDMVKKCIVDTNNTFEQVVRLIEFNIRIKKLLNSASSFESELSNQEYLELSEMQSEILYYIDEVMQNGYNVDVEKLYNNYLMVLDGYNKEEDIPLEKININGFVLFDFGDDNIPYVVTDLDPHSKNNLIDGSILQGKCDSGFQDYSNLVNDILLYGGLRAMVDETYSNVLHTLLTPVYLDKNSRKNPSGMMRVRPSKSSLVRFISRDVVLKNDTAIYYQVVNLLEEIIPGIEIDRSSDFKLVINFASSMKKASDESYHVCLNRYNRHSPLYRLFFSDSSKVELSHNELDLLRDIIHMSMDAYFKLENVNDKLRFDIIRQIGGKNTYGK